MARLILPAMAVLGALLAVPGGAHAYVPDLKTLYEQVAARSPGVEGAILETVTQVYNPFMAGDATEPGDGGDSTAATASPDPMTGGNGDLPGTPQRRRRADGGREPPPVHMAERDFRQVVYWMRGRFLAVETYGMGDDAGELLHFYWYDGARTISHSFSDERVFVEPDVLHPYLPFMPGDPAEWQRGMTYWGLAPNRVELAEAPKRELLYRLADGPERAVWLQREPLRVVRLDTVVEGDAAPLRLSMRFEAFLVVSFGDGEGADAYYPRTVHYLLNGRLFKETATVRFEANPSLNRFPLSELRSRARRISAEAPQDVHEEALP